MINESRHKYGIDPRRSYVVGDKNADMLLARSVGAKGILVKTGQQKESPHADFVAEGLQEAVDFIMRNERA
jgi:D-glycero-D-manno-heptose 1,7-bisphosphate phosphatase